MKFKNAYTLIELSVVLVIISLISGLIFYGINIKQHAQFNNIYTQFTQITRAMEQFEGIYGSLPGDLAIISRLPTTNSNAAAGNGNGIIDSGEVLQFWLHLSMSGLYPGNFIPTASYQYIPAIGNNAGGFPAGPILNSGFTVSNDTFYGIMFNLSSFISSTTNYTTSVLAPGDSYYVDNKYDDGVSNSGIIRGLEGSGVTAGNCQANGIYNQNYLTTGCYMYFYPSFKISAPSTDSTNTCTGAVQGTQRVNTDATCPFGTYGRVVSTCNPNSSGAWTITKYLCEPVKCYGGATINVNANFTINVTSQQTLACPANTIANINLGFGANGINCTPQGTFSTDNPTYGAATQCQLYNMTTSKATSYNNGSCLNGYSINVGCPVGTVVLAAEPITCNSTTSYNSIATNCIPLTCTVGSWTFFLGQEVKPIITSVCNSTYYNIDSTATNNSSNQYPGYYPNQYGGSETCILPLTKGSGAGVTRLTDSFCVLKSGVACGPNGSTRTFNCPFAYSGTVTQTCTNGYWLTTTYGCQKLTCGGAPLGSFRIAEGVKCTGSGIGNVVEVCDYCDTTNYNCARWYRSYANCI